MEMLFGYETSNNKVRFSYWAPYQEKLSIILNDSETLDLEKKDSGMFEGEFSIKEYSRYKLRLGNGEVIPDPFSRFQPEGVHGSSQIININESYSKREIKKEDMIIYEIHVGTFTSQGNFDGIIEKLDYIKELDVNTIELMPINQFPGDRGWGYDETYLFAVQNSYGGPLSLKRLVKEAHRRNLWVILDVIYNHMGPEGNYLGKLGPYFSNMYRSPWGLSFNLDGNGSDFVRDLILSNVDYWIRYFDIDGFRLDAIHAIFDTSPIHILQRIAERVHKMERVVIAESDLNDPKIIREVDKCGYGIDAQWCDDFHHSLHAYVTGERTGYYEDYGNLEQVKKTLTNGYVYDGIYSKFRNKTFGEKVDDSVDGCRFIVYIQNHDQVGNRGRGERISTLVGKTKQITMAAIYLLSPFIPMIFMGEEYGESNPFLYFSSFSDDQLIQGVREGRKRDNGQDIDPQARETFELSKLSWNIDHEVLNSYKKLIQIRKMINEKCKRKFHVEASSNYIKFERGGIRIIANFASTLTERKFGTLLFKYGKVEEKEKEYQLEETGVVIEMVARPGFEPGTSGL